MIDAGRRGRRAAALAALALVLASSLAARSARAQTPDSLAAPAADSLAVAADSLLTPADTARGGPLLPLDAPPPGAVVDAAPPASTFALGAPPLLARLPAAFLYDPGTPGAPAGWSRYALAPDAVALRLDGRPLDDGVTGRPAYDLLPWELLAPLALAPGGPDAPHTLHARLRPYVAARPYTELRYRSADGGLQRIAGVHSQNRRRTLLGQAGLLGALFGYVDGVADGEYPGARARTRHLALRLRFYGPRWSAELSELNSLHRAGAHGGVVPFGGVFGTVYNRFDPQTENPRARRQTIRNDLAATLRARLLPAGPTTLTAYWTRHHVAFTDPDRPAAVDTLRVRADRLGAGAEQTFALAGHRLRVRADAWLDAWAPNAAVADAPARLVVRAVAGDSLRLGGTDVYAEAGVSGRPAALAPSFVLDARRPLGPLAATATLTYTARDAPFAERVGFGPYLVPVPDAPLARTALARAGLRAQAGAFDASAFGFAHTTAHARLLLTEGTVDAYGIAPADTVRAVVAGAPVAYAGAGLDLGWRRDAARGLYAVLRPTVARLLDPGATDAHARLDAALPRAWVHARLGVRARLFRGDLALDARAEGTAWTALRSRTLHPATGRLALPPAGARAFGPSGTLDLIAEAGVRTATFFVAWENALSGTVVTPGNLVVPVYPLPDRRFRFGVYWPILD